MIKIKKHPFYTLLLLFHFSCQEADLKEEGIAFESLLINSKENPLTVENEQPLFSWIVNAKGYDKSQSAYRILVASSLEKLNENVGDVWDSSKVDRDQSSFVVYEGTPLIAMNTYYWKVKIWDEKKSTTGWSDPQKFEMGLMGNSNWGDSQWITLTKNTQSSEYRFRDYKTSKMAKALAVEGFPASYFRKLINLTHEIEEAQVYICGLGYYELYLNGQKVGDHVLDPAPSNYDKQAYYVKYDITEPLKKGKNALGIILGNGFYGQNISWKNDPESDKDLAYGAPTVKCLIKVKYSNGAMEDFYTDDTWRESTGPIVFNNIYGGDTYDARYELGNWTTVDYDASSWGTAKVAHPKINKISAQHIPPIRKLKELEPQKVFKGSDGEWIVDFGQNIAGWVKLRVKEKMGQRIDIRSTEALLTDGSDIFYGSTGGSANGMPQMYSYICKGKGIESWEPQFSYHGFRYVKIKGVSTKPDSSMIKAVLVATDIRETGRFTSSDGLLNKMHTISKWTIVDNIHGIPEDCPHREKCGWLGDAHAFCEYALYNYDMYDFYLKYMEDIRTQMRPVKSHNDPEQIFKVPTMIAPGKRTSTLAKIDWGVATMYLPWYHYKFYGDVSIIQEYYDAMKGLTEYYLSFKDGNGIMQNGMGDWCPPRWDRRLNPSAMECHPVTSANAYFYDVLGIMETLAKINKDAEFEAKMKMEKEALKKAFNQEFLVEIPNTDYKWYESQTATVMALQFGMVPEADINKVVNGLVYDIVEVKQGHHSTGIHGNRYIYTVLTEHGKADLAYQILTTPDFPSQTYVMNSGFTTWPERQFEWEKMDGPTNSLNHPMHSGFAAYFYESLGGIRSSTEKVGFKEFMVNPQFPSQLTSSKVEIPSYYGTIRNEWHFNKGLITMNLKVPFNTRAKLILTQTELKSLRINGKPVDDFESQKPLEILSNSTIVLGSGDYEIKYIKEKS